MLANFIFRPHGGLLQSRPRLAPTNRGSGFLDQGVHEVESHPARAEEKAESEGNIGGDLPPTVLKFQVCDALESDGQTYPTNCPKQQD